MHPLNNRMAPKCKEVGRCANSPDRGRHRVEGGDVDNTRACLQCGASLAGKRRDAKWCSRACSCAADRVRNLDRRREDDRRRWAESERRRVLARKAGQRYYYNNVDNERARSRARGRLDSEKQRKAEWRASNPDKMAASVSAWAKRNADRRAAAQARRRARSASVGVVPYSRAEVYESSGWVCGLCGEAIDPMLPFPNPRSKTIDHIVPLSLGGPDERANVQPAHFVCNITKGARMPERN